MELFHLWVRLARKLTVPLTLTLTKALLNAMDYLDLLTLKPSGGIDAEERI
jgi:hypothetical protein